MGINVQKLRLRIVITWFRDQGLHMRDTGRISVLERARYFLVRFFFLFCLFSRLESRVRREGSAS